MTIAHQLGIVGTISAVGGGSVVVGISWLNTNAEGLGVIIGFLMFCLQFVFLMASLYIKIKDKRALREEVEKELKEEYAKILEMEEHSEEAIKLVDSLFKRI